MSLCCSISELPIFRAKMPFFYTPAVFHLDFSLKMIGKGFVLFKINSSPTAFKTHLHYRDWFSSDQLFLKNCQKANPKICLRSCSCAE